MYIAVDKCKFIDSNSVFCVSVLSDRHLVSNKQMAGCCMDHGLSMFFSFKLFRRHHEIHTLAPWQVVRTNYFATVNGATCLDRCISTLGDNR